MSKFKKLHIGATPKNGPKSQNLRFSINIATLDHHCSQTRNAMTKWLGIIIYLHIVKLQLRGHAHWRYGMASMMSQSRGYRVRDLVKFRKKNWFFFLNRLKIIWNVQWTIFFEKNEKKTLLRKISKFSKKSKIFVLFKMTLWVLKCILGQVLKTLLLFKRVWPPEWGKLCFR